MLIFASFSFFVFYTGNIEKNDGYAFNSHKRRADVAFGFCQLTQFVVMTSLTVYLMVETLRFESWERTHFGRVESNLHRGMRTQLIVFAFFALSYLGRSFHNLFLNDVDDVKITYFGFLMICNFIILIEGTSLGILLYFHYKNFGLADSLSTNHSSNQFATIKPEEI